MTPQELCAKYGISELNLQKNFPRVQASIFKKTGVKIIKQGRGKDATYREEVKEDMRAITLYGEMKEVRLDEESLGLMSWEFMVFLTLLATPMLIFRGTLVDFLRYIEFKITDANKQHLQEAIGNLVENDYIMKYNDTSTNEGYFVLTVKRKVEKEMKIEIGMIQKCKQLAAKHNKRSWIPLVKTWVGIQLMSKEQPFTMQRLCEVTGLSEYQARESKKLLESDNYFRTNKKYAGFLNCLGQEVDLNGFYKENQGV